MHPTVTQNNPHSIAIIAHAMMELSGFVAKPEQVLAAAGILSNKDVWAILSTGFGKSMIAYILPKCFAKLGKQHNLSNSLSPSTIPRNEQTKQHSILLCHIFCCQTILSPLFWLVCFRIIRSMFPDRLPSSSSR
jgi:hypothetical protein